jgi:integrase
MASIDKRRNGYRVRWRDPDGRARSRQCPNHTTAKSLAREVEEANASGRRWEPRDACPRPELQVIFRAYMRDANRVLRPQTAIRYARALDQFIRWTECRFANQRGPITADILSKHTLAEWYEDLAKMGRHGRPRSPATCRKLVEVLQLAWAWSYDDDVFGEFVPRPRKLRMPREDGMPTIAPTWAEMDACILHCTGWRSELAILLRFTGLRVQQAMGLRWDDFNLDRATLRVRGELGKSQQERRGRIIPVSAHLVDRMRTWDHHTSWVIQSSRAKGGDRERMARARDMERAWSRAGVRKDAYCKRPHHAYRKGFVSELKRARADVDAVEFLVGHSLGLRGVY